MYLEAQTIYLFPSHPLPSALTHCLFCCVSFLSSSSSFYLYFSVSHSPLSHVSCLSFSVQWVQTTSVMRTRSSPARQTTAVFLGGHAVTAPTIASTTATSKAVVSASVSADVLQCGGTAVTKTALIEKNYIQGPNLAVKYKTSYVFQNSLKSFL